MMLNISILLTRNSYAAVCKPGRRHLVTFMLFLGMANAYIMRTNLSIAIVAMVNQTAIHVNAHAEKDPHLAYQDGVHVWSTTMQGYILSSFFYGYVITQIPFGLLDKSKYGSRTILGVGMLINSLFAFLIPAAADSGAVALCFVRFIQGLGEGPIVPCTHAMLTNWIPPSERSRLGAVVFAGAQFGTVISMPLTSLLAEYGFAGGWPSIFYIFGTVGVIWSLAFVIMIRDDPESDSKIKVTERIYIVNSLGENYGGIGSQSIPWSKIFRSMPFWAIMLAHMGQNYGYETLMTELPTFMRQVLRFHILSNGLLASLPYLCMWIFSIFFSILAEYLLATEKFNRTGVRKLMNSIGEYGPALGLIISTHNKSASTTVAFLTIGVALNGGIYSGFKINHSDLSPRFASILISFTNCSANFVGLFSPIIAGHMVEGKPTAEQWRKVFYIAGFLYIFCATFYNIFASGEKQFWNSINEDSMRNFELENTYPQRK